MADIEQKQYSTADPWTIYLNDASGWIDLSTADHIILIAKLGSNEIGPLTTTITATHTFTGDITSGSNVITAVSSFTDITDTSTLIGTVGIPPLAKVSSFDSVSGTITMSLPATANGSSVTVEANVGMATYLPLSADVDTPGEYPSEAAIHWDNTNTLITIVPSGTNNPTILINPNLTGSPE